MAGAGDIDLLGGAERLLARAGFAVEKGVAAVGLQLAELNLDGGELSEADEASLRTVSEQLQGMVLGALATLQEMHQLAPDVIAVPVLPAGVTEQKALPPVSEPNSTDHTSDSNGGEPVDGDSQSGAVDLAASDDTATELRAGRNSSRNVSESEDLGPREGLGAHERKRQIETLTKIFGEDTFDAFRQMEQEETALFAQFLRDLYKEISVHPRARPLQPVRAEQLHDFIIGMPMADMEKKYHVSGIKPALDKAIRGLHAEVDSHKFELLFNHIRQEFQRLSQSDGS